MDQKLEPVIKEFLSSLRICLSNSSIYAPGHSVIIKSVDDFKAKADALLAQYRTFEVLVGPSFFVIGEDQFEKEPLVKEMAHYFHRRSVKSLKFVRGVSIDELSVFCSKAARRPAEQLKEGGLTASLKQANLLHISAEMLDYSSILSSAKEDKDIWGFLLHKAVDTQNFDEIDELINSFDQMIRNVGAKQLVTDNSLATSIGKFLMLIRTNREEAFVDCTRIVVVLMVRNEEELRDVEIPDSFREIFQYLPSSESADIFLNEVVNQEELELGVFEFYCNLFDIAKHNKITEYLQEKIRHKAIQKSTEEMLKKTAELIEGSDNSMLKEQYLPVLQTVDAEVSEDSFYFDRRSLNDNFRNILLHFLASEHRTDWLPLIVDQTLLEFGMVPAKERLTLYRTLLELVQTRDAGDAFVDDSLTRIKDFVAREIESRILKGDTDSRLEFFMSQLKESTLGENDYFQVMFDEERMTPHILRCVFIFFPDRFTQFHERLQSKLANIKFILDYIRSTKGLPATMTIEFLKRIYPSPNAYIKIEVLRIMQTLDIYDEKFMEDVLTEKVDNFSIKEEAIKVVMVDDKRQSNAMEILRSIPFQSRKNYSLIHENLQGIYRADFRQAKPYLETLLANKSFWNKEIWQLAQTILEEWGS